MAPDISDKILEYIKNDVIKAFGIQEDEKLPAYRISDITDNKLKGGLNVEVRILPNQLYSGYDLIKDEVIYRIHVPENII